MVLACTEGHRINKVEWENTKIVKDKKLFTNYLALSVLHLVLNEMKSTEDMKINKNKIEAHTTYWHHQEGSKPSTLVCQLELPTYPPVNDVIPRKSDLEIELPRKPLKKEVNALLKEVKKASASDSIKDAVIVLDPPSGVSLFSRQIERKAVPLEHTILAGIITTYNQYVYNIIYLEQVLRKSFA